MKSCFRSILAVLLVTLLVLSLFSCTKQKMGDDSWMDRDIEVNTSPHIARPQKLEGDEDAYQAGERIDLPTIPVPAN